MSPLDAAPDEASPPDTVPGGFRATDPHLRQRTFLPIAGTLALLLVICAAAAYLGVSSEREGAAAAHEEMIAATATNLQDELLAAEAGQRGFLVTGRMTYLAPFVGALAPINDGLNRLDGLVAGNTERSNITHALRAAMRRKLEEMRRTIELASDGRPDAAHTLVNTDLGRQLTEQIKSLIASLQSNVSESRHRAVLMRAHSISLLMAAIGLAAAGAILMAVLAMREVRRHLRMLEKRETQLDRLIASLEARVARRTRALQEANERFQLALDSSHVTVFSQDRALVYSWISQSFRDVVPEQIVGHTDADFLPAAPAAELERLKRGVITTGDPARAEIRIDFPPETLWQDVTLLASTGADGSVTGLIGAAVDISERKQFESHVRLLMREVTHRSKNLLAVIQALMRQTASHAGSVDDFTRRFSNRLDSLAGTYDLLIKEGWRGTTMEALVRSQLAHYTDRQSSQIDIEGVALRLPPDATQNIGMALHELATNAAKYGALSAPAGRVRVHWQVQPDAQGVLSCSISWRESGGPPVTPPRRRGFGQLLIERIVARSVGGTVALAYNPTGVEWTLDFPVTQ
jgi:two-component sensor histidine kinase/CHASE3 domain sensor protein